MAIFFASKNIGPNHICRCTYKITVHFIFIIKNGSDGNLPGKLLLLRIISTLERNTSTYEGDIHKPREQLRGWGLAK